MESLVLGLALLVAPAEGSADASVEADRRDEVARLAPTKARQIEVLVGDSKHKASLKAEPLLRWSNPTAGSVYGEVFLWSYQDRPVAIASIYRWYHPHTDSTFEVVSTTKTDVEARQGKDLLWRAKSDGLHYEPLADAPTPADAAGKRLSQMRTLARRFSAQLIDKRAGEPVTRELRLLNQPVHRYESPAQKVIDGALFALVEVTDPEVWVLLEAVKQDDRVVWQYGLARMNADACEVHLDDKPVQQWDRIVDPWRYRVAPYTLQGFNPEDVKVEKPATTKGDN